MRTCSMFHPIHIHSWMSIWGFFCSSIHHRAIQKHTNMHPHTHSQGESASQPNSHVCGLQEEAGVPGERTHI